jgi:signal transduction histidine kinase/CheY-like chemotaxis protein
MKLWDWIGAHLVQGRGDSEKRRALGRALHGMGALAVIGLSGPWRDGAFGSLLLAPLLAAAWTVMGWAQFLILRRRPDGLVGLQYFTIFMDAAVFAVFLCDAPRATAFIAPYLAFIAIPVGLRYGVRAFWFAWAGLLLTAPAVLYLGNPFWTHKPQVALSLVFLALLPAAFFGPLLSQWRHRQQKDTEENQLQALEAAMVAKSAFLARVSHQLRSPLQAIMSSLELMEAPSQQANRPRLAANISAAAQRLSQELRDLLTIARAEAWQLQLEPSVFEAGMLLKSVAAEIPPNGDSQGRKVLTVLPQEPLFLMADSDKIMQVLTNVAKHVCSTAHPHTLTLGVRPHDEAGACVTFVVEGEAAHGAPVGAGGTAQDAPTQLAGENRRDALNDSLSLTLVRTLVEFLGGSATLEWPVPQRLRFSVQIPCELVREDESQPPQPMSGRVLLVSAKAHGHGDLAVLLAPLNLELEYVASVPAAANRLALREYALVCVDMNLPRHNGQRLALGLKSSGGANRDTPLLAFNARAAGQPPENPWPFDAVMADPISKGRVATLISSLLPGKSLH